MNMLEMIREFYPKNNEDEHVAEFNGDVSAARKFAEGVRDFLVKENYIVLEDQWKFVRQSNCRVFIILDGIKEKVPQLEEEAELTAEAFMEAPIDSTD